jgi:hypothetical protein
VYNYVFVRKDIPLADQLVQVGHVCLEAGTILGPASGTPSMVLLQLNNLEHLKETKVYLECNGIKFTVFNEPDDNMGETAICTEYLEY